MLPYPSIQPPICLADHPSTGQSIHPYFHFFLIHPFARLPVHPFTFLPINPAIFFHFSIHCSRDPLIFGLSICVLHPFFHLSSHPSVCPSIQVSVFFLYVHSICPSMGCLSIHSSLINFFIYQFINHNLLTHPFIHPSINHLLSHQCVICLSRHILPSIHLSDHSSIHMSIHQSICRVSTSIHMFAILFVYPSIHPSMCLSVHAPSIH